MFVTSSIVITVSGVSLPSTLAMFLNVPVAVAFTFTLIVNVTGVPGATSTFPKSTWFPVTVTVAFSPSDVGVVPVISSASGISSVTVTLPVVFPLFVNTIV